MTERKRIIDKIKKLLRLSTSPNEHEAALALQRAMEMMEKYSVDPGEVRDEEFHAKQFLTGTGYKEYEPYIVHIVSDFFHVRMVRIVLPKGWSKRLFKSFMHTDWKERYDIYGKEHHIIIAEFVFMYLCRTFATLWKNARKSLLTSRMRRKRRKQVMLNYFYGVYVGLYRKLAEAKAQQAQEYGIVHLTDEALDKFVMNRPSVTTGNHKSPRKDTAARLAGWNDGRRIEINKTLTSADGPVRLLASGEQ